MSRYDLTLSVRGSMFRVQSSTLKLGKQNLKLGWLWRRGSPLTIPNREVKPVCADGTADWWESRPPPCFNPVVNSSVTAGFFYALV